MDPTTASYKRFWEPSYLTTMGLSLFAGTIATAITHPIEYIKTVIQFRSEGIGLRGRSLWYHGYNPHRILRQMHGTGGGLTSLYGGFQANLYARLGYLVVPIYDTFKPAKATTDLTSREKAVIGGIAGGFAAYITTPLTLISIRQILDSQTKLQWRRNYSGISQGLEALKKEGKSKGTFANVLRHVLLNMTLTGPYDYWHEALWIRFGDYAFVQPMAMLIATLTSSLITLPIDNIRTRLMNSQTDPSRNRLNYGGGILDAVIQCTKVQKHPRSLWAGFYTYFFYTYLYATLTVGITREFTETWKRKQGLQDWKI